MDLVLTSYDEKLKPLLAAVEGGNLEVVRKWISDGAPLLNPKSRTPSVLAVAAEAGFFSMLELLLASGDWRPYPKALNAALCESVNRSHVDNSKLLLDNGAEPGAVGWYSIFATHKRDLVTAFLEHGKDTSDIGEGIEEAEWGTARALRDWLEHDKSPEQPLLLEMISALDEYYSNDTWYKDRTDFQPREENERAAKHADRIFSLIRWTGVDTRRKVSTEESAEDSVFAATVRKGTRNQLRALGKVTGDAVILNAAALEMDWCDKSKFDYMVKCGLVVNDRDDGTSTLLLQQFKTGNQTVLKLLADQDARLPEVEEKDLLEWNRRFYRYSKPAPGILLSLAKILTEDQFSVVVSSPKAVEVFGATSSAIVADLYDAEKSESPDTLAKLMEKVKAELKGAAVHPLARNFRGYCLKADREPLPPDIARILGHQSEMCNFKGNQCSKEIRPWIITVLNSFFPLCIQKGARFRYEEVTDGYRYRTDRPDIEFIAEIDGYKVPLVFREVKVKPKPYLLREPASDEVYSGKLQLCHYLGRRPNAPEVIAKERSFLWFKDHVEDLVEGLFAVVEKQKKSDERERAREERLEKERQERQAAEHERYLKQQAEAKAREEEMRRQREEAERAAAQKEAEERLFFNALVKARSLDDCRQVKGYVDEICALTESLAPDVRERILSWADSVRRVIAKKEGWSVDPFSPLPKFDKGLSSGNPTMIDQGLSGCFSSPERNYWANRGWWNKR